MWLGNLIQIKYLGKLMERCFNEPWLITLFKVLDQYPGDLQLLADCFFIKTALIYILNLVHKIKTLKSLAL